MSYVLPNYEVKWKSEQHFQRIDKYANFLHDKGRLETWEETVTRVVDVLKEISQNRLSSLLYQRLFELLYMGEIAPSMRLMAMSKDAIKRDNTVIYNCSFGLCDRLDIFAEALYLGMSGCGVAFSVEKKNISKLPIVAPVTGRVYQYTIPDTQEGWGQSVKELTYALFNGDDIEFDYSEIRPSGTPLKIKGGFASGPEPLETIHNAMRRIITNAQNRQLKSIEIYDLMNWMLEAGISGATRRSAGLVLFDNDDDEMLNAKYDGFWNNPEHKIRANSNNTVVYEKEMTEQDFNRITEPWFNGLGEPGLYRRDNAINNAPNWRTFPDKEYIGINSCGEISMAPSPIDGSVPGGGWHFCNLSSVHARQYDTIESLEEKVFFATLIGDIQSLATDFLFLSEGTKKICDRDRLLGVSLIGYAVCPIIRHNDVLAYLKSIAEKTDLVFSKMFNVPRSAAITTVKPSGNSSQLYNTPPGANVLHGKYIYRHYTVNKNSTMHKFLEDNGVERFDYPGREYASWFRFPIEYEGDVITLENVNAIEQLEIWKKHTVNWCHHNTSCSITYHAGEEDSIKSWLQENQTIINALAFFPYYHSYGISPIQVVSEEEFRQHKGYNINWNDYSKYDSGVDERTKTVECGGGACEIVYK
jgi:ribonucleoside-triphosphate reductase